MQNKLHSLIVRSGIASLAVLSLAGCATGNFTSTATPVKPIGSKLQGKIFGGQQPVIGATIQLYAAGTLGYGSPSYALLTTPVLSTAPDGGFGITGDYICPSASSQVYVTATSGNAGTGNNPNLTMMAALGNCGDLTSNTFVFMNELTTVAAVYALSPFMTAYNAVGTTATNTAGLANAFATAQKLVNTTTGATPGIVPSGTVVPTAELNTLADILASCVNSNGGNGNDTSTNCGRLFSDTRPGTSNPPTETIGAMLQIARNPGNNTSDLLSLAGPTAPFQPTLAGSPDFSVSIKYGNAGLSTPSAAALDANSQLWVTNSGNNTISRFDITGTPTVFQDSHIVGPNGVAIDASGNAFITSANGSIVALSQAGTASVTAAPGTLTAPTSIAIDATGALWVPNAAGVTKVTVSGTTLTNSATYSTGGVSSPIAVAVNPH